MKIFNPTSGNDVDIEWAVSQDIINENGEYLADDGSPTTILEVVDPDVDLTEEELQERAQETVEAAEDYYGGGDEQFETSDGVVIDSMDVAQEKIESLLEEKNELTTKSNFLYEEKQRLEERTEQLQKQAENESNKVERLRNQLQQAEDTILDLREELRQSEQSLEDAEDQITELEDTEKTYENTDIGGIRVRE